MLLHDDDHNGREDNVITKTIFANSIIVLHDDVHDDDHNGGQCNHKDKSMLFYMTMFTVAGTRTARVRMSSIREAPVKGI